MSESNRKPGKATAIAEQIHRGESGNDRQRPQPAWQAPANRAERLAGPADEQIARRRVAAMLRAVSQRPEGSCAFRLVRPAAQQLRADLEQDAPAQREAARLSLAPGKRLQQRQPCIFELTQLTPAYAARQKLLCNRPQARLRGPSRLLIELLQPFAPPGEPDRAEPRVAACRDDIGEGKIEIPQRRKGGPDLTRQLLERDLAVVVERALSDR